MRIKLTFLGAAQNVTGSRYLVEANDRRILVDCGMHQERELRERDWNPFPMPPDMIDALLLSHAHLDHCGLVPKFVREGFNHPIYCTEATAEIVRITLLDSAHLQEEDAAFKRLRHQKEGRKAPYPEVPLYTTEDAQNSFQFLSPVKYEKAVSLGGGVTATFHDAGHVLGSAMIELNIRQDGEERTIVFSGDIGRQDKPILKEPSHFHQADYLVVESTYGDRLIEPADTIPDELAEVISSTEKLGGNIVIPSFALERAQEVLYYLNDLLLANRIPHLMVFLDSPMAISITEVFKQHPELFDAPMRALLRKGRSPFELPGLKPVATAEESKAINHVKGTAIIIAGSGMCTGGRIKHHLVTNISRPESTILFVGYQAVGTLGRQIVDGAPQVRILGQNYEVKARVVQIHGFSGHADREQLLEWVSALRTPPRRIFVTHGEPESAKNFASLVKAQTGWETSVPDYRDSVALD